MSEVELLETPKKKKAVHGGPFKLCILKADGSVARVPWPEAYQLNQKGLANFLSRTLYKAAKAGLDVKKLKGQSDRDIKEQIKNKLKSNKAVEKKAENAGQKQANRT